jgi:hypothetical protein
MIASSKKKKKNTKTNTNTSMARIAATLLSCILMMSALSTVVFGRSIISQEQQPTLSRSPSAAAPGTADAPWPRAEDKFEEKPSDEWNGKEWHIYHQKNVEVANKHLEDLENNSEKESPTDSLYYAQFDFEYMINAKEDMNEDQGAYTQMFDKWLSPEKIKEIFKSIMEKIIILKSKEMGNEIRRFEYKLEKGVDSKLREDEKYYSYSKNNVKRAYDQIQYKSEEERKKIYGTSDTPGRLKHNLKDFLKAEDYESQKYLETPSIIVAFLTALSEVLEEDHKKFNMSEKLKSLLIKENMGEAIQNLINQGKISEEVIQGIESKNPSLQDMLNSLLPKDSIRPTLRRTESEKHLNKS